MGSSCAIEEVLQAGQRLESDALTDPDKVRHMGDAELPHDPRAVNFDGLLRDPEVSGNLFVESARDQATQHLPPAGVRGATGI